MACHSMRFVKINKLVNVMKQKLLFDVNVNINSSMNSMNKTILSILLPYLVFENMKYKSMIASVVSLKLETYAL